MAVSYRGNKMVHSRHLKTAKGTGGGGGRQSRQSSSRSSDPLLALPRKCGGPPRAALVGCTMNSSNIVTFVVSLSRSTVVPPKSFLTKSPVLKTSSSWSYLLKYGVPRHPDVIDLDRYLRKRKYMDFTLFQLYPFLCASSSHETFVRENRWFLGGAIVKSVWANKNNREDIRAHSWEHDRLNCVYLKWG